MLIVGTSLWNLRPAGDLPVDGAFRITESSDRRTTMAGDSRIILVPAAAASGRITESGDNRTTIAGDARVTE